MISQKLSNPRKQKRKQLQQPKQLKKMVKETTVFKHPKMPTPFAPYSTLKCQHHLRFQTPKTPTPFALPDPPCSCCKSCSWSAKAVVLAAKVTRQFDWCLHSPMQNAPVLLASPSPRKQKGNALVLLASPRPRDSSYAEAPMLVAPCMAFT